jgi:hypothetical protein
MLRKRDLKVSWKLGGWQIAGFYPVYPAGSVGIFASPDLLKFHFNPGKGLRIPILMITQSSIRQHTVLLNPMIDMNFTMTGFSRGKMIVAPAYNTNIEHPPCELITNERASLEL